MPQPTRGPAMSRLLDALPARDRKHLLAGCEQVDLVLDEVLCMPGERIKYVLFPTGSFISMIEPVGDRSFLEVGLVGDEGMLGASLALDVGVAPSAHWSRAPALRGEWMPRPFAVSCRRALRCRQVLNRYLYVVMRQLARTAACTRYHHVDARLARWLLMTRDRAHANTFNITHEFLAFMLGVRRASVTQAAGSLKARRLIRYVRGNLTIVDPKGLEAVACDCYAADCNTYSRVMN